MEDFGFTNFSQAPAQGQARGIVVLWNATHVKVDNLAVTNQEIHFMVQVYPKPLTFLCSAIYASPYLSHRKQLWQNLKCIANTYSVP